MNYTSSLHVPNLEGEPSILILTGSSDGKSVPRWTFNKPVSRDRARSWEAVLMERYNEGLYGTGSIGQVRDMVHAMDLVAEEFEVLLVIPDETAEQIQREIDAEREALPKGGVH